MFTELEKALEVMHRMGQRKLSDLPADAEKITLHWDYVESIMDVVIKAEKLVKREQDKRVGLDLPAEHV